MKEKIKNAVIASFIGDALSLGVHWVYDTAQIKSEYGRLEEMTAPKLVPYHQAKEKGDFTHYGDQAFCLLTSIAENQGFELEVFQKSWTVLFEDYSGYVDGATKDTLKNMTDNPSQHPTGSLSDDLGGAARIAPVSLMLQQGHDAMMTAAQQQTAMTHNQGAVIDTARFFAKLSGLVIDGQSPVAAMETAMDSLPEGTEVKTLIKKGLESGDRETPAAIKQFGQMCSLEGALPSTIHLIARYETDLKTALIENIMAGGDSSARGLMTGFILGAHNGLDQLPDTWKTDMTAYDDIVRLIEQNI